jgi:uncharacterized protein YndB with AHSA1/START domain
MILKDTVQIKSPPEKVWAFIEDPQRMKSWNPKVQTVSLISWGERNVGYRYRITYVMSQKAREFLAEITEYKKPERLVLHLTESDHPTRSSVDEIYQLSPTGEWTLLEQRIEINNSGMNIFLRLLVFFIMRFGKPTGKKYLETLKELVEGQTGRQGD